MVISIKKYVEIVIIVVQNVSILHPTDALVVQNNIHSCLLVFAYINVLLVQILSIISVNVIIHVKNVCITVQMNNLYVFSVYKNHISYLGLNVCL